MKVFILGVVLCMTLLGSIPAYAIGHLYKDKAVTISIDRTLLASGTVKYVDLIKYDNSSKLSGSFVKKGDDVRRHTIPYQNNAEVYKMSNTFHVIVDPPTEVQNRLPGIIIVSKLDSYFTNSQMTSKEIQTNDTKGVDIKPSYSKRTISHTRYVPDDCKSAVITSKNLDYVLLDTISYLRSGCEPTATKINTTTDIITPLTKHDISTSYKSKDQKWRDYIIKECLKSRNACPNLKQPTRGGL